MNEEQKKTVEMGKELPTNSLRSFAAVARRDYLKEQEQQLSEKIKGLLKQAA